MTIKKKINRKNVKKGETQKKKKIQRGGNTLPDNIGTDGDVIVLINDMFGMVSQTFNTVQETVNLIDYIADLDTNLGYPYSPTEYNAPGANLT